MNQEKLKIKYRLDRRTIIFTILLMLLWIACGVALYLLYEGGYFSAWFCSFIIALVTLAMLSVPRRIELSESFLTIYCNLDMTQIAISEIASISKVEKRDMRYVVPLFGSCGFFGYYGIYFDLANFERVKVYASQWNNFVEITDISEERYYINCDRADELIEAVQQRIEALEKE